MGYKYIFRHSQFISAFLFAAIIISGTSVANPLSDVFQLYGSIKYSDIFFAIIITSFAFFSPYFITYVNLLIKNKIFFFILFLFFIFFVVLSILFNPCLDIERTFFHLLRLFYYFFIILLIAYVSTKYLSKEAIVYGLYLGIFGAIAVVLYLMFIEGKSVFMSGLNIRKLGSEFGANPVATYAALLFPVGLYNIFLSRKIAYKIINIFIASILVVAMLLAESKAAWIATGITITVFFFLRPTVKEKIFFLLGVILLLTFFFDDITTIISQEINTSTTNTAERITMYKEALQYFLGNPFFGFGYSNYIIISPRGYEPHSAYALLFAETGILGGGAYCMLLLYVIFDLFSRCLHKSNFNGLLLMMFINISILGFFTGLPSTQSILFILFGLYLANNNSINYRMERLDR